MGEYEQKFLNALIQRTTIIQLKNLLHKCELKFSRTVAFSYIQWNHYSEYIVFKVSPTDEQDFRLYENQLESLCYDLYEENEVYDLCGIEIKIKIDDIDTLPVAPEIHFGLQTLRYIKNFLINLRMGLLSIFCLTITIKTMLFGIRSILIFLLNTRRLRVTIKISCITSFVLLILRRLCMEHLTGPLLLSITQKTLQ